MNELISIATQTINNEDVQAVNARELWRFLELGRDFSTWVKARIEQYEFEKGKDFVTLPKTGELENTGLQRPIEYIITIDMAKELAMVERNRKGKEVREYFIKCEREANRKKHLTLGQTAADMVTMAKAYGFEGNHAYLSADKATLALTGQSPLKLLGVTNLINDTQELHFTPTELGGKQDISARAFNKLLEDNGFQTRVGKSWKPTYRGKSYAVVLDTGKKHSSGVPIQQVKWKEGIMKFLFKV